MDKLLGRKIQLDKITIDIENARKLIKSIETELSYKQKEIDGIKERISKMESVKGNLERIIGGAEKVKVEPKAEPKPEPKPKKTRRRRSTKTYLALLALLAVPTMCIAASDAGPKIKMAYDASNNVQYIGKAAADSNEDLSPTGFFQIKKLTYDGSGNLTDVKYADGNSKYDNSWANRAALTYK